MEYNHQKRLIFAGPLQHGDKVGGVVVLFQNLVRELDDHHIVFDTNGDNYSNRFKLIGMFVRIALFAARNDIEISLHGTVRDFKYLGSVLLFFNLLLGLRFNTRKFGGSFQADFIKMPLFWKMIIKHFLSRSQVNFFETKALVDYFKKFNPKTFWLPNYRKPSSRSTSEAFHGKFVFIGHVKRDKGIDEILAVANSIHTKFTIDIFGPLIDYSADDFKEPVSYRGIAAPSHVPELLAEYDALLLPTFHYGEGYPGVIIEAFSVGLPVITTNWLSLPEIVNETCGILIQPKDASGLFNAMQQVETAYSSLRIGALEQFREFDQDSVVQNFLLRVGLK